MSDELLPYYHRELSYIRRLAAQFADAHPKLAGRLRLGPGGSEDPHVERLLEGFAYLNARLRAKLDDEFPEITEAFLGVLYPHYLAPVPSLTVLQLHLDPGQLDLTAGHTVPRHTQVESEPIQGTPCRFRTAYPVTLWPVDVERAALGRPPFAAPAVPAAAQAAAMLRLTLACRGPTLRFAELELDTLRFFLAGQVHHVHALYELLFHDVLGVAVANGPDDPQPVVLGAGALRSVGFAADEGLLPYSPRSFLGYRLLTEFFAFPEKFLFCDVALGRAALASLGRRLELYVFLGRAAPELESHLSAEMFRLGCTPAVNLYPQRAEPLLLTHADAEYRVVPDARRPLASEVYSVDRVTATSPRGEELEFLPFFAARHAAPAAQAYWFARRRPSDRAAAGDRGTEVDLSLVDLGLQPSAPADWTLTVETTCTNRDLPARLPFGGGQPFLQLSEGGALVSRVACVTPPTRALRPGQGPGALWRLVSHLTLNHRSLEGPDAAEALRAILSLYDYADTDDTRLLLSGLLGVDSRRIVGRSPGRAGGFCHGVETTVVLDEDRVRGSLFLFASVLERFLGLYVTVNSFSRLVVTTPKHKGEYHRWPPRMGERTLL